MDYNHTQVNYECSVKEIKEDIKESVKEEAFQAMGELEGWCTRHKASVMMDLIFWTKPKVVVEIGVWGGKSLIPMAFAVKALGDEKFMASTLGIIKNLLLVSRTRQIVNGGGKWIMR